MKRILMLIGVLCCAVIVSACTGQPVQPTLAEITLTPSPQIEATSTDNPVSTATQFPTLTATPEPSLTPSATIDPTLDAMTLVTVEPLLETDLTSPIQLSLPRGWELVFDSYALPFPEEEMIRILPFSIYRGPVTGGTGVVVTVWGFENIVPVSPIVNQMPELDLWADGLRVLFTVVLEPDCNIGRGDRREFSFGDDRSAVGSYFWAVDCGESSDVDEIPPSPDVQGWFVALQERGVNMAIYAYVEPREAIAGDALYELQAIMDTIIIDVPETIEE